MTVQINHHVVLTDQEQVIAVQAVDFYFRYVKGVLSEDDIEQAFLASAEYGMKAINDLANKIATSN